MSACVGRRPGQFALRIVDADPRVPALDSPQHGIRAVPPARRWDQKPCRPGLYRPVGSTPRRRLAKIERDGLLPACAEVIGREAERDPRRVVPDNEDRAGGHVKSGECAGAIGGLLPILHDGGHQAVRRMEGGQSRAVPAIARAAGTFAGDGITSPHRRYHPPETAGQRARELCEAERIAQAYVPSRRIGTCRRTASGRPIRTTSAAVSPSQPPIGWVMNHTRARAASSSIISVISAMIRTIGCRLPCTLALPGARAKILRCTRASSANPVSVNPCEFASRTGSIPSPCNGTTSSTTAASR